MENIHPIFHHTLTRSEKEKQLAQQACVIWLTGLSGSGKSSIAIELEKQLHASDFFCALLDGDNIRTGINNNLGFSLEDRTENIRRIAEVARLFVQNGVIVLCCFVSPEASMRAQAKAIIGEKDFIEVYVNTPLEVCEKRDVKGLYKKARAGEIKNFTGIHQAFEEPENPSLVLHTEHKSIQESTKELMQYINPFITRKHA